MFSSQSRVRIVHLRSQLSSSRKGDSTCTAAYYVQMKGFANEMAAIDKRLEDEEVIWYILAGLDVDFNPFIEAFTAKTEPQTLNDLYSQLLIAEARVESQKEQQQISANAAYHGGSRGGHSPMCGHEDGGFVVVEEATMVVVVTKVLAKSVARPATLHSVATNALMQATTVRRNMSMRLQQATM
jgi:hypothetical protein